MDNIVLLKLMRKVWRRAGLNLLRPTKLMDFTTILIFVSFTLLGILAILVPVLEESNLSTFADAFQIASPIGQVLIKLLVVKFSMKNVREMLQKIQNQFWRKGKLGPNVELKMTTFEKTVDKILENALHVVYVFALIILLRPLLEINSNRQYPLIMYNIVDINDDKMYALMFAYQSLVFFFGPNLLLAVDGLYILFVSNIFMQLTMLKHAFAKLRIDQIENDADEEKVYLKLKEYVDHHNLILRFIKDFGELYSFQILCQFLGNTLSLCMGIFLFYGGGTDITTLIRTVIIIFIFIIELVFFCAGGTIISELCQDIAPEVFYNGWERMYSKRIRIAVFMIIMRSNKPEIIKAGKMFHVNLTSIGQILKAAVSTFTLMTNINASKTKY